MTLWPRGRTTLAIALLIILGYAVPALAANRVVDPDGAATATNCNSATPTPYTTIPAAVDAAIAGDTITICPETYDEHVVITRKLKIQGKHPVVIRPTVRASNTTSLTSGAPIEAIILVDGGASGLPALTGVVIDDVTVDGSVNLPSGGANPIGIYLRSASGTASHVAVRAMKLSATNEGTQQGLGIFAQSGGGGSSAVIASNSIVYDFQKNGSTGNGVGTTLTATSNTVVGWEPTPFIAQNGIQIGFGAGGEVSSNLVSNVVYSPRTPAGGCGPGSSTGILLYALSSSPLIPLTVQSNQVNTTQGAILAVPDPCALPSRAWKSCRTGAPSRSCSNTSR